MDCYLKSLSCESHHVIFRLLIASMVLTIMGVGCRVGPESPVEDHAETVRTPSARDYLSYFTPEIPGLSDRVSSSDGTVVISLPKSLAAANVLLDISSIPAGELPLGRMPPMRAFYIALLAPDKTPWQPREPQPATLAILLTEADYDLADGDPYRLSVRRYNQSSGSWEETQAVVDLPWLRVPVRTDALGLFATVAIDDEEDRRSPAATAVEIPTSQPSDLAAAGGAVSISLAGTASAATSTPVELGATFEAPVPSVPSANDSPPTHTPSPTLLPTSVTTTSPTPAPTQTPVSDPPLTPTPTATLAPTSTPATTPTPASTSTPTFTPTSMITQTPAPVPKHPLFINGRQVLSKDAEFYVPLGILTISDPPDSGSGYPVGTIVTFDVRLNSPDFDLRITGADSVEGLHAEVLMDSPRSVTVYIWPRPTPEPVAVPASTDSQTVTPTPTVTPALTPVPVIEPQPAPEPGPVQPPSYPPGGRIAFQKSIPDGNSDIYLMGCDGANQVNLTSHQAEDKQPSWGGNGLLAFSSNRGTAENAEENFDIYLLDVESLKVSRLTTDAAADESPALSALGGQVAFVSHRDGNAEIYVLDIAENVLTNVTNNPAEDLDPSWSSDGNRLAFASNRDGDFDIYIANADGYDPLNLTDAVDEDGAAINERWPDFGVYEGTEVIAFSSNPRGNWEIYTFSNADGFLQITNSGGIDRDTTDAAPSWSPSGEEVVFHTIRDRYDDGRGEHDVFRITEQGEHGRNLTKSESTDDINPDWELVEHTGMCGEPSPAAASIPTPTPIVVPEPATPTPTQTPTPTPTPTPTHTSTPTPETPSAPVEVTLPDDYPDGGRIAFQTDRDGNSEIYVMGCDGSGQTNLTNSSAEDKEPSWATGGKLAFSSNRNAEGGYDIYLLTLDLTLDPWEVTRLTTNAANDESPALSPDGSKVAFVSYRDSDGDADIFVMKVSDRSVVKITDNTAEDLDPAWSPDGTKLAFASDRDGNFDIFKADADGSNVEKMTTVSDDDDNDRWPDLVDYYGDENIVFATDRDGDWEVNYYDGYELFQTTENTDDKIDDQPSWSKSGEQMVFHSTRSTDVNTVPRVEVHDVFKAFPDGGGTNLTRQNSSNNTSPDWEPVDGVDYCAGD